MDMRLPFGLATPVQGRAIPSTALGRGRDFPGNGHWRVALKLAFLLPVLLAAPASLRAQVTETDMSDKLKALQIELEDLKRKRDGVVADRWKDKKEYNDAREAFNQEYDDRRRKLELKAGEKDRLREDVQVLQKEGEELEARVDNEKAAFLGMGLGPLAALRELAEGLDKRFPLMVPDRQRRINAALEAAEARRDSPDEMLGLVGEAYRLELTLTREVSVERKDLLLSDQTPGNGLFVRAGMIAAAYRDDATGRTGLLLGTGSASGRQYQWREDLAKEAKEILSRQLTELSSKSVPESRQGKALLRVTLPVDVLRVAGVERGYTAAESKGFAAWFGNYLRAGGIWMWPLGIICALAVVLLLERFTAWALRGLGSGRIARRILGEAEAGRWQQAVDLARSHSRSPVSRALTAVLKNREGKRETAEKELQEVVLREAPALERRLATLSVLGAAAPLLGLLGTVAGMIQLFDTITLYGTSDPKLMARGISIALITTQTGLAISVPILIAHNWLANRMDNLVNQMESFSLRSLNLIWPGG